MVKMKLNNSLAIANRSCVIIMPHRSYVHRCGYCYRPRSVVCRSVCLSVCHTAEPMEMQFGLRTLVGPMNHVLDGGSHPPMGRTSFEGKKGAFHCKARLPLSVQKWLNRKRCCLGFGLWWAQGSTYYMGVQIPI